jgi:hypothetical protein
MHLLSFRKYRPGYEQQSRKRVLVTKYIQAASGYVKGQQAIFYKKRNGISVVLFKRMFGIEWVLSLLV